jgi:pilus assembly protein Flp/PilA
MSQISRVIRRVALDDRGASLLEYGLLATLIAVVVALALPPLGAAIRAMFVGPLAGL